MACSQGSATQHGREARRSRPSSRSRARASTPGLAHVTARRRRSCRDRTASCDAAPAVVAAGVLEHAAGQVPTSGSPPSTSRAAARAGRLRRAVDGVPKCESKSSTVDVCETRTARSQPHTRTSRCPRPALLVEGSLERENQATPDVLSPRGRTWGPAVTSNSTCWFSSSDHVTAGLDGGVVDEHVLAATVLRDEAQQTLFGVEPLDGSLSHASFPLFSRRVR